MNKPTRILRSWTEPSKGIGSPQTEHEEETEALHSVEYVVNAKGGIQPTVKTYSTDPDEAAAEGLRILRSIQESLITAPIPGLRLAGAP